MALTAAEIQQIRAELGYNQLTISAIPYISYVALFDDVVRNNVHEGASTTSATVVAAAATPTAVALVLTNATNFTAGDRVLVDVDSLQEEATIRSITGSTISVILSLAHTGTYPVVVKGGVQIVRALLKRLQAVGTQLDSIVSTAGLKRAEDIEWYQAQGGASGGSAQLAALYAQRDDLRDQLSVACGVQNRWKTVLRAGGGASGSVLY